MPYTKMDCNDSRQNRHFRVSRAKYPIRLFQRYFSGVWRVFPVIPRARDTEKTYLRAAFPPPRGTVAC